MEPVSCPPCPGSSTIRPIFSPRTLVSVRSPLLVRSANFGLDPGSTATAGLLIVDPFRVTEEETLTMVEAVDSGRAALGLESVWGETETASGSLDLGGIDPGIPGWSISGRWSRLNLSLTRRACGSVALGSAIEICGRTMAGVA